MPQTLTRVGPGDIISATNWNLLVDAMNEAMLRLAALEAGTTPGRGLAITQLSPAGPYRIGDRLQILGQNFQFSIGATRVFLNATQVLNLLPTSSDSQLEFVIPTVPGVVETGSTVDLVVLNQSESATRQLVLRPRPSPLQGVITVEWQAVTPTTITAGAPATFIYRIRSGTNNRATWAINPQIDVAANTAAWNAQLRVLDTEGTELSLRQITLDPDQQVDLQIRIATVPSGTNGVTFGLTVNGSSGNITGSSGIRQFLVGTPTPDPDATLALSLLPAFSAGALSGSTLTVPAGQSRVLAMSADVTVAGTYTVTRLVLGGATGWAVNLDSGTVDSFTITPGDIAAGQADPSGVRHVQRLLRYAVVSAVGATTPAQIQITVQRQTNPSSRSIVLNAIRG